MAQRFYELLSYHLFATLTHRRPHATLRYASIACSRRSSGIGPTSRSKTDVQSPPAAPGGGLPDQVRSTPTTDADGQPDWLLHYTPGPKARAEYAAFRCQPGGGDGAAPARRRGAGRPPGPHAAGDAPRARRPPPSPASHPPCPHPQAQAGPWWQFYQRFHGLAQVTPTAKELTQATRAVDDAGAGEGPVSPDV